MTPVSVIICAAGRSTRFKRDKLMLACGGSTVIEKSVRAFDDYMGTKRIILAVSPGREEEFSRLFFGKSYRCTPEICTGGENRHDTVKNALELLRGEDSLIAVHDGARPFVSVGLISSTADAASLHGGALPVLAVKDTVHVGGNGFITGLIDRSSLTAAQTPQIFAPEVIFSAYERISRENLPVTDECSAVVLNGGKVAFVPGEETNIKITTPEDLKYIGGRKSMRIGHGYDVHRLVPERKLILGGVEIPHSLGLLGHSDADVLLHAISDSLLGALALGDIGKHFPDSDPAYKGISSLILLKHVAELVGSKGYCVVNVDATVCCQKPKLAPHIEAMRKNIAGVLGVDFGAVSIKATTEEKLGFTGREEGISATAVCLLEENR